MMHRRRWWWPTFEVRRTVIGLTLLAVCVGSVVTVSVKTNCQTRQNIDFRSVLNDRSDFTDRWMTSQLAYLDIVADQHVSAEQRLAALNEYRAGLRAAIEQRKNAPLPEDLQCD